MALSVPTFKQREVRALLEEMLAKVTEHETNHDVAREAATRNMNETDRPMDRDAYSRKMDYHQHVAGEFQMLRLELKSILHNYGVE